MINNNSTNNIIQIGNMVKESKFENPQIGRVYSMSGICPTINTCGGGNLEPKVLLKKENMMPNELVCEERVDEGLRTFKDDVCGTIRTIDAGGCKRVVRSDYDNRYTIRKLTPLECWRLMGFSDDDYKKTKDIGMSNRQLYKQAGNSIVVDVLYYIYRNLYNAMPYLFDELKVSSYFSGIGAFEKGLDKLYEDINAGNFINPQVD